MFKFFRLFKIVHIRETLVRAWALMRHPGVPIPLKAITVALALFIVSPLNILGDIPLIGIFDDVALLSFLLGWFVKEAERRQMTAPIHGVPMVPER